METRVDVTVSPVEPTIEPDSACAARIVVVPCITAVANPVPVIVATDCLVEDQVTELVRFCVLPSVYVPVAVNCTVRPLAAEGLAGVTAMETSLAGVTLKLVELEIEPRVA